MENYYNILNISKNADSEEIKKAFRTLAMQYHPDKNPGNKAAEERFKKVNEAYSVLSDPEKKREYDARLNYGSGYMKNEPDYEDIFRGTVFDFRTFTETHRGKRSTDEKLSPKEIFLEFILGVIYSLFGLFLLRASVFLGIFGWIISFYTVANGIRKIRKAYNAVFNGS